MSDIFREKSLERMASQEQMDDYIKVTTPSIWIALLAIVVLAAGIVVWSTLGTGAAKDSSGNEKTMDPVSVTMNAE